MKPAEECRFCAHFRDEPEEIERRLKGLTSLSSGYGSVRGKDGLCAYHERFCNAHSVCTDFIAARSF